MDFDFRGDFELLSNCFLKSTQNLTNDFRILTEQTDVGLKFEIERKVETERNSEGELSETSQVWIKIVHIPAEIDVEHMVRNISDLGLASEEEFRRNNEVMRRMIDAKTLAEKQLEEEREKRTSEGGIIWPVWSWITGGKQPSEETSGLFTNYVYN